MPSLKDVIDGVLPAWRGVTSGVTMGLHKYPAAAAMVGMDQLMGDGKLRFGEALDVINEQQRDDRENSPIASYGGELVGSLSPAAVGGKAVANISRMTTSRLVPTAAAGVVGAGQGAISGFNERQDLGDAALGATLGGAGGAAGQAVQTSANAFIRNRAAAVARQHKDLAMANREAAKVRVAQLEAEAKASPKNRTIKELLKSERGSVQGWEQSARKAQKALKTLSDTRNVSDASAVGNRYTQSLMRQTMNNTFGARGGGVPLTSLAGGALGAGYGVATGQDPLVTAGLGAGGFLLPATALKAGALAKFLPQGLPAGAGIFGGKVAGQMGSQVRDAQDRQDAAIDSEFQGYFKEDGNTTEEVDEFDEYFK